jgi:acetyl esterase/lipase
MKKSPRVLAALVALLLAGATRAADEAPGPILLWEGKPPQALENPPAETVDKNGHIEKISAPSITVYLPPKEKRTGMALIICPGGGYRAMDWITHVVDAAACFNPKGIAVIGLKYRTSPPYDAVKEKIQAVTLLDAQRAVRMVRRHAAEWGLDPRKIGVAGYSAGGNLTMNLAGHFDEGHKDAADPVERESCHPDFVVGLATWHWHEKVSPFTFRKDTPPMFLVHASDDGINGGAPIELPQAIKAQLEQLGVPVHLEVFDKGGHGVGNLIPQRVKNGFPGAQWPDLLLKWLGGVWRTDSK